MMGKCLGRVLQLISFNASKENPGEEEHVGFNSDEREGL
jgi:hypothetical protein